MAGGFLLSLESRVLFQLSGHTRTRASMRGGRGRQGRGLRVIHGTVGPGFTGGRTNPPFHVKLTPFPSVRGVYTGVRVPPPRGASAAQAVAAAQRAPSCSAAPLRRLPNHTRAGNVARPRDARGSLF